MINTQVLSLSSLQSVTDSTALSSSFRLIQEWHLRVTTLAASQLFSLGVGVYDSLHVSLLTS